MWSIANGRWNNHDWSLSSNVSESVFLMKLIINDFILSNRCRWNEHQMFPIYVDSPAQNVCKKKPSDTSRPTSPTSFNKRILHNPFTVINWYWDRNTDTVTTSHDMKPQLVKLNVQTDASHSKWAELTNWFSPICFFFVRLLFVHILFLNKWKFTYFFVTKGTENVKIIFIFAANILQAKRHLTFRCDNALCVRVHEASMAEWLAGSKHLWRIRMKETEIYNRHYTVCLDFIVATVTFNKTSSSPME